MDNRSNKNWGTVYLIGAGPGDPGLITVKGKDLLQKCDVVLYDNLIPDELVVSLPPEKEAYYVGKRAGKHCLKQEEINNLLVKLAREGKSVARLKGSDPLIFGRGGEEAKHLRKNGIEFEIVPGVTAGIAVPAYSGIPCTDRDLASMVTFVTGHKATSKSMSTVHWERVAKAKNGTLVIYMGVGQIEKIVGNLLDAEMPPETPAAVIEHGTVPTQRTAVTELKNLPAAVKENNIQPPAIFVIGEVVRLRDELRWFARGPLFDVRIMVTRPADQAQEIYQTLRSLGAEVLPYPTIFTREFNDNDGWRKFDGIKNDNKWLILTSENGVRYFFDQLMQRTGDVRVFGKYKIAAVGYGTARAMEKINLKADFIPTKATTASLAEELAAFEDFKNASVVRIRGNLADDRVEKILLDGGAEVIPITVYETIQPKWPEGFKDKLFERPPDVIIFTSGSTASGLCSLLNEDEIKRLTGSANIVSIGPSTTGIIESLGMKVALEAGTHSIPGVIDEIVEYYAGRK
jgi:uroporphyrinogen III methyltransferase/synthase